MTSTRDRVSSYLDLSRIRSLGLRLVYNLAVYQLRGSMEYRRQPEPELVFTFRDVDYGRTT